VNSKKRKFFTSEEEEAIIEGYRRYGNSWATIRSVYKLERSPHDIKDKVRNLQKKGKI
jgi:hypothetical protein